jgi:hypothetical protein
MDWPVDLANPLGSGASRLRGVSAFLELLHDLVVECHKVVGRPARDKTLVADHLLVNPVAACVLAPIPVGGCKRSTY